VAPVGGHPAEGRGGGLDAAVAQVVADALAPLGVHVRSQLLGPADVLSRIDAMAREPGGGGRSSKVA
jgi:hypothetical protein